MTDGLPIPTEWITSGSGWTVVGVIVWMILTARLVPRRFYTQLEKDRDYWREAARKAGGQAEALIPAAEVATELVKSFSDATEAALKGRGKA